MNRICLLVVFLISTASLFTQAPPDGPLPDIFEGLDEMIIVNHFPSPVLASKDKERPGTYFWKHNTSVLSPAEDITILEGGAYIYYNDQWNLRVSYAPKDFSDLFDVPNNEMKAGEPYTFVQNWRTDSRLLGGWALWYIIGETVSGEKVYGAGPLWTAEEEYSKN